jgi:lipopolysaccharide export LptBFGC system permease protein LptF
MIKLGGFVDLKPTQIEKPKSAKKTKQVKMETKVKLNTGFDLYDYVHENRSKFTVGNLNNGFKPGQKVVVTDNEGKKFLSRVSKQQFSENTVNLGEHGTWDIKQVKKYKISEAAPKMKSNKDVDLLMDIIGQLGYIGRKYKDSQRSSDIKSRTTAAIKAIQNLQTIVKIS